MKTDIPLQVLYLSWVNDFSTLEGFAKHYGLSDSSARDIIARGRSQQESIAATNHQAVGNIAFWGYDQFPYLLHGVIKNTGNSGSTLGLVYVAAYQNWFKPVFCLPPKEGHALEEQLAAIKERYEFDVKSVLIAAKTEVRDLLPAHVQAEYPE